MKIEERISNVLMHGNLRKGLYNSYLHFHDDFPQIFIAYTSFILIFSQLSFLA